MGDSLQETGKAAITYETLFDTVVREKGHDELQLLSTGFFTQLVSYLNEKRSMMNLLGPDEKERTSRQLQNINRLIKELYERREKKILQLALARSRAGADIVDTSALLNEEKVLFENIVSQLDFFRQGLLNSLLTARQPQLEQNGAEVLATASKIIKGAPQSAISGSVNVDENSESERKTKLVRFLHAVPKFVGSELEIYGPFDQEDIANLPREIADVLIAKGRAEEMASA